MVFVREREFRRETDPWTMCRIAGFPVQTHGRSTVSLLLSPTAPRIALSRIYRFVQLSENARWTASWISRFSYGGYSLARDCYTDLYTFTRMDPTSGCSTLSSNRSQHPWTTISLSVRWSGSGRTPLFTFPSAAPRARNITSALGVFFSLFSLLFFVPLLLGFSGRGLNCEQLPY